jgi:hypothetical protein
MTFTRGKTKNMRGENKGIYREEDVHIEVGRKKVSNDLALRQSAITNYAKELKESKLPAVLSSYMGTDGLPEGYKGIDFYVRGIRKKLIEEAGGELSQLQMVVLDGISETLILSKYITTYIGEDVGGNVIATNKFGQEYISEVVTKGFAGLQALLDKKIKQFREMCEVNRKDEERDGYLQAVMGKTAGTTRGKTGR